MASLKAAVFVVGKAACGRSTARQVSSLASTRQPGLASLRQSVLDRRSVSHSNPARTLEQRSARSSIQSAEKEGNSKVRVRFAPSPTGNLHVGGARTALFNWLFARANGGKFIIRIEDTDLERSTRESEQAVLRDLAWLGLDWDEGPDVGGAFGPYRQSERNEIYRSLANKLLEEGKVYRCFCTDAELEAMRVEAEARKLPPKYTGKWASATEAEVQAELAQGTPHTFRFRVPENRVVTINDLVRGEVSWNTDTLGDFVILRSNGQPVYNFCVAVDDASMGISHVVRAEEHLPNTLRQALIYQALGFKMPTFGHVSLILAPDRSKLSKRHGATSVGQFKEMGFLSDAMVNYLALLGWNDGTEDEIFTPSQLVERFSLDRVTKSAAIFDTTKLRWMNGQHLRQAQEEQALGMLAQQWVSDGLLSRADQSIVQDAAALLKNSVEVLPDASVQLQELFAYPLAATLASEDARDVVDNDLAEVAEAVLAAYDRGELQSAIGGSSATWSAWVKGLGKTLKRKGKRLFMPLRILLTGRMHGPDVGAILHLTDKVASAGVVGSTAEFVPLEARITALKETDFTALAGAKAEPQPVAS